MAARPQNIGIKAIEIYFPSQVRALSRSLPILGGHRGRDRSRVAWAVAKVAYLFARPASTLVPTEQINSDLSTGQNKSKHEHLGCL